MILNLYVSSKYSSVIHVVLAAAGFVVSSISSLLLLELVVKVKFCFADENSLIFCAITTKLIHSENDTSVRYQ